MQSYCSIAAYTELNGKLNHIASVCVGEWGGERERESCIDYYFYDCSQINDMMSINHKP